MTQAYDDFVAEVTTKLEGLTSQEYVEAHPGEHLWATYDRYESCAFCGIMRSRDDKGNKPCVGIVRIGLRHD